MQEAAAEVMKSSHPVTHKKTDWLDLNRSRRLGRWGFPLTERRSQAPDVSIQNINRPVVDIRRRSSFYLQSAAKFVDAAHVLGRSKFVAGLSKVRQTTTIPLPPIKGSRGISRKGPDAAPAITKKAEETEESSRCNVLVKKHGKVNQESNKVSKITALTARKKSAIKDSKTRSRQIQQTVDGQPDATSTPAPADPTTRQKNDASDPGANDGCMMKAKLDASVCREGKQKRFCFIDSAIETESELSGDKGCLPEDGGDEDEDYYTEQRITEWILKVNYSLFSTEKDTQGPSSPVEEQDVATIKIIYDGD